MLQISLDAEECTHYSKLIKKLFQKSTYFDIMSQVTVDMCVLCVWMGGYM